MNDDNPFGADIDLAEMEIPDSDIAGDDPFSDFENLETAETDPEPLSPQPEVTFESAPTQMEEMLDEADDYAMDLPMVDDAVGMLDQQDDQTLFMAEPADDDDIGGLKTMPLPLMKRRLTGQTMLALREKLTPMLATVTMARRSQTTARVGAKVMLTSSTILMNLTISAAFPTLN